MPTTPTSNPVPSESPSDLLHNAGLLDTFANSAASAFTDRLGNSRKTVAGFEVDQSAALAAFAAQSGYSAPVAYTSGLAMTVASQTVSYNGNTYAPISSFLPFTTSGTFETAKFRIVVGVSVADLAATGGSSLVGYDGGTVQDVLDSAKPIADYTALRAYTGRATSVRITTPGIAGVFRRNGSAADNGGTVIVDGGGRSWERLFDGAVIAAWFGAVGNGVSDETVGLRAAFTYAMPLGKTVVLQGDYKVSGPLHTGYEQASASLHIHCVGAVNITVDPSATAFRDLIYCESTAANNGSIKGGRLRIDLSDKCASGITCRHNDPLMKGTVNFSAQVTVLNAKANDPTATYENQGISVYGNYLSVAMNQPAVIGVARVNDAGVCKGIAVSEFSGSVDLYSPRVENVLVPRLLAPGTPPVPVQDADGIAVFGRRIGTTLNARAGKVTIHNPMLIDCQGRSVKSQCSDTTVINPTVKRQMVVSISGSVDFDFQFGNGLVIEPRYEYRKNGATSPLNSSHSCVAFQNKLDNMEMASRSIGGVLLTNVAVPRYCAAVTGAGASEATYEVSDLTVIPISGFTDSAINRGIIEFTATEVAAKSTKTHFCVNRLRGPLSTYLIAYTGYVDADLSAKLSYDVTDNTNTRAAIAVGREFLNQADARIVAVESWTGRNNQGFADLMPDGWTFNFSTLSEGCTFFVNLSAVAATNAPAWGASGYALIECLGSRTSVADKSVRVTKDNADAANTVFYTRNGGATWGVIK